MEKFYNLFYSLKTYSGYDYIIALSLVLLITCLGYIFRKIFSRLLIRLTSKTKWEGDDLAIKVLSRYLVWWFFILGIYTGSHFIKISPYIINTIDKSLVSLIIITATLAVAEILIGFFDLHSQKVSKTLPATGLTRNIIKLIIIVTGLLVLLNTLGVSITPILTTLGIGGLAVALALQDTLSNLFAGLYITLGRQINVGDFVKLESGEKGYIQDINWRSTKVKVLPNNIVLIPNSKLAQSVVTNYHLPQEELSVLVQVGVHYESNLEKVEKITIDVAKEVMREVSGGVPEFEPFIRYHTFADFSINFTVILRAKEFVSGYLIKHEFIKRLHKRFSEENIIIPYPIAALNLTQEESQKYFQKL